MSNDEGLRSRAHADLFPDIDYYHKTGRRPGQLPTGTDGPVPKPKPRTIKDANEDAKVFDATVRELRTPSTISRPTEEQTAVGIEKIHEMRGVGQPAVAHEVEQQHLPLGE